MNLWLIDIGVRNVIELREKNENVCIVINLMTWDLQDIGVVDYLVQCLEDYGASKTNIKVALSEKSVMKDNVHIRNTLNRLKENEINIVLTNFGSSFELMAELPNYSIKSIKLSKKLTDNIETKESNQILVGCICQLAHNNNIKVMAEDVISFDLFNILCNLGCDYFLGSYLSQPVQLLEAVSMLSNSVKAPSPDMDIVVK